jgi:hypothetical protein
LRPPPWLALPPLLAISRCLAGSIAAKPRFDRPLELDEVLFGIVSSPFEQVGNGRRNAHSWQQFNKLIQVSKRLFSPDFVAQAEPTRWPGNCPEQ